MPTKIEIENLEESYNTFGNSLGRKQGELETMISQQQDSEKTVDKLKTDEENYTIAVELLTMVQKVSRDKIKDSFENIVTHALNFIFDSDKHTFCLVFSKRGSLPELKFAVQTPDKPEPFDPLDTDGGSVNNIISLALRIVLMEVCQPKINGFILTDEAFNYVDDDYLQNASLFLKDVSKKLNRQIISISHEKEMINVADNVIEIK